MNDENTILKGLGSMLTAFTGTNVSEAIPCIEMNGRQIHSLEDLRRNFDLKQAEPLFLDGTLIRWLKSRFYNEAAERVDQLEQEWDTVTKKKLCSILGVHHSSQSNLTPDQRRYYEEKRSFITSRTGDAQSLPNITEIAVNQTELAEFLHMGKTRIYLCGDHFNVPINKSGTHYIGIGDPKVNVHFTEEQYRRAGVTFEQIALPQSADPAYSSEARSAATAAGYDDYWESHDRLASAIHYAVRSQKQIGWQYLEHKAMSVMTEDYRTKAAARNAARRVVNDAYDKANAIFRPENDKCIAANFAERYSRRFQKAQPILEQLKRQTSGDKVKAKIDALEKMISNAEKTLRDRFEEELRINADCYFLYDRNYFLDEIEVTANDYNVDLFESDFANRVARTLFDETEYTVDNLLEITTEMQNDMNSHADLFYGIAYEIYLGFCRDFEALAEDLGKCFSAEELEQMELPRYEQTGRSA